MKMYDTMKKICSLVCIVGLCGLAFCGERKYRCVPWERLSTMQLPLPEIGRLRTRTSLQVRDSLFSIDCCTLDRDYANFDMYKDHLGALGVKHARIMSGWGRTERSPGNYDFSWLDRQVDGLLARGVQPWISLGYGNPLYGSDSNITVRVSQVTGNPTAFSAWLRFVRAIVAHYRDRCDEWEIWNEPYDQGDAYAELYYRTAKAIRSVQPGANCYVASIRWKDDLARNDYYKVLEKLKRENALDLATRWIYHAYEANPDTSYEMWADKIAALVKRYTPSCSLMSGECGCPSQLEWAHAMNYCEWTEYSQAKWALRRALGDAIRKIPSNYFAMTDNLYPFMLQSFGLIRSNGLKAFVYRRPSYYAMQNLYAVFDNGTEAVELTRFGANRRAVTNASFRRDKQVFHAIWYSDQNPSSRLWFERITLPVMQRLQDPVWAELITGRVCEMRDVVQTERDGKFMLADVPIWDSPILVMPRSLASTLLAKEIEQR